MSTHNICFRGEIRKIITGYPPLSGPMNNNKKNGFDSVSLEQINGFVQKLHKSYDTDNTLLCIWLFTPNDYTNGSDQISLHCVLNG